MKPSFMSVLQRSKKVPHALPQPKKVEKRLNSSLAIEVDRNGSVQLTIDGKVISGNDKRRLIKAAEAVSFKEYFNKTLPGSEEPHKPGCINYWRFMRDTSEYGDVCALLNVADDLGL